MENKITIRPATEADADFLYAVYYGTRRDEVAAFGWDDGQADAFLRMQYTMQTRSYQMQYPAAGNSVIILDQLPAGRMLVDRGAGQILLIDIAVLPEYRKRGMATHVIGQLQDESAAGGKPVVLMVDKGNLPALSLYRSLGFDITAETDLMYEMKWAGKSKK